MMTIMRLAGRENGVGHEIVTVHTVSRDRDCNTIGDDIIIIINIFISISTCDGNRSNRCTILCLIIKETPSMA